MSSEKQQDLSSIIKETHAKLREEIQRSIETSGNHNDTERIWKEHAKTVMASDKKTYASAMGSLAQKVWDKNEERNTQSRILWIKNHLERYFIQKDYIRFEQRLLRKLEYTGTCVEIQPVSDTAITDKLKLLDVGSCYNPFSKYPDFDVVAVDLCPAPGSVGVMQCDFVNVEVEESSGHLYTTKENSPNFVKSLSMESYDAVIFSLLLEYLPLPQLRFEVCEKAYKLIRTGGLLIIVTPDSSHQGKNLDQIRRWHIALAQLGFIRIYIEKLRHLRCIAFVKVAKKFSPVCAAEASSFARKLGIDVPCDLASLLEIPQDSTTRKSIKNEEKELKEKVINEKSDFREPFLFEFANIDL